MTIFEGMVGGGAPSDDISNYDGEVNIASPDGNSSLILSNDVVSLSSTGDMTLNAARLKLNGGAAPASSTDNAQAAGYVVFDSSYMYVSTGPDTWRRVTLDAF